MNKMPPYHSLRDDASPLALAEWAACSCSCKFNMDGQNKLLVTAGPQQSPQPQSGVSRVGFLVPCGLETGWDLGRPGSSPAFKITSFRTLNMITWPSHFPCNGAGPALTGVNSSPGGLSPPTATGQGSTSPKPMTPVLGGMFSTRERQLCEGARQGST